MAHPNSTVITPTGFLDAGITTETKKFIIQSATSNDIKLSLSVLQKRLLSRINRDDYSVPVFPKPNSIVGLTTYGANTDIAFQRIVSPNFPLIIEKIKICIHKATTFGCIKLNLWDYGLDESVIPTNLLEIESDLDDGNYSTPLTISPGYNLVSNVLESEDTYMQATSQVAKEVSLGYTIQPNSILRFGIQYAEGNAYGLKIFIIGWTLQCD